MLYADKEKCPFCNCELELDYVDFNFEGDQNEYYICRNCGKGSVYWIRDFHIFACLKYSKE